MTRLARPRPSSQLHLPGYQILGRVSRGRAFEVYDVWSAERQCRCIAKVVRTNYIHYSKGERLLLREGRLLQRLNHPHIVRLYELYQKPSPALILETLTGATLAYIIEHYRRLTVPAVASLGVHLCSAMHYLHHHAGFLHRDLKPSNIASDRGYAKVFDFSIATRLGRGQKGAGTPGYLSPEQAYGDVLTEATDVWGIGVVLFEAATGKRAFRGKTAPRYEPLRGRPPSVRTHRRLPLPLVHAIDGCLEPDARQRPTVTELLTILTRYT